MLGIVEVTSGNVVETVVLSVECILGTPDSAPTLTIGSGAISDFGDVITTV